jgi:hypothetical protein
MQDDEEDGGEHHKYDLWAEDPKTRRHREWQEDYQVKADLGHDAELEREVQEFESGVAAGFFSDDEQVEIVRKLIKRGVSPDRIGIRKEDKDRATQTVGDQQYATDKEMTLHWVEGSPEFEYTVSDRKQSSRLEIEREAPVAFVERGLVSRAAGGYDLACELLRGYFLILQNPMTKETEHIVSTQILALVQGIENRLRVALETLIAQLTEAKTLHAQAVGICKICRAEPSNPFVQVIVNTYGTKKETITTRTKLLDGKIRCDKRIIRAEPNQQTIRRVLKRLGQTRDCPVSGRSARAKASNLVARIQQTAPLLWVGKDAILRTVHFGSKASQGRIIGLFDAVRAEHVRPSLHLVTTP